MDLFAPSTTYYLVHARAPRVQGTVLRDSLGSDHRDNAALFSPTPPVGMEGKLNYGSRSVLRRTAFLNCRIHNYLGAYLGRYEIVIQLKKISSPFIMQLNMYSTRNHALHRRHDIPIQLFILSITVAHAHVFLSLLSKGLIC